METIYLSEGIKIEGKKPKLKFDILESLALVGKLSKSELRIRLHGRYYADISHSVDELSGGGFIMVSNRKQGRGREQVFYTITNKGLRALLVGDENAALRFWEILYSFCLKNDELVSEEKIEEFYQIVIERYLKYSNHGFSFQLDNFHDMCNKWLGENILKSNKITVAQKVIEVLALNPKITLEELTKQSGESEYEINHVLSSFHKPFRGLTQSEAQESLGNNGDQSLSKIYNPEYDSNYKSHNGESTDFFTRNIIISRRNKTGQLTYELSLFGVMLSLVVVRYNDLSRLKAGLFKNYSVHEYYDKMALKYRDKLPLIFGKWKQLKQILKVFAVYNFDVVMDKENCSNNALPQTIGGNKELFEGIRGITLHNRQFMEAFTSAGLEVLKEYCQGMFFRLPHILEKPEFEKVRPLCYKLADVFMLLHPTAIVFPVWNVINFKTQNITSILKDMEEAFAYEITAMYYLNLCNDINIRVSNVTIEDSSKLLECSPMDCLSSILKQDKEGTLKEWFSKCMKDLENFQEDVLKVTKVRMRDMSLE